MSRVVVIGAGAAGTMAAIWAASRGAETLLLERTRDGGRKILISGGGRCNVLPARLDETRFVSDSSENTLRKMVRSWPLAEQISFFEQDLGIPLVEEPESAKLFPVSNRARDVRDGLLQLAERRGARLQFDTVVAGFRAVDGGWRISCADGTSVDTDAVIIASGGLSVPNTGSDGAGLAMLAALGHTIHPLYAALTPITAEPGPYADLAGVSLRVTLTAKSAERSATASGGFLFTHRGYSGPAALDVSHVLVRSRESGTASARLSVEWTPLDADAWEDALRPHGARTVAPCARRCPTAWRVSCCRWRGSIRRPLSPASGAPSGCD
jgi:predicted Rossmann fold flavoprotein